MIAPARVAAYETVLSVASGRSDLPHALARARASLRDERDRALAGEIATGTIRWQRAFDRIISEFSGRAIERLDREVLVILRLTIFQLLHLDRVPASAAVNDAVDLTRRAGKRSAAAMINAVLRRVSRERRSASAASLSCSNSASRWSLSSATAKGSSSERKAVASSSRKRVPGAATMPTAAGPHWVLGMAATNASPASPPGTRPGSCASSAEQERWSIRP